MKVLMSLVVIFLIWLGWAIFSTGSFYELKQLNRNIERTRSLNFLTSKLYYTDGNGFWDSYYVESCSLFMPNWAKAEDCVRNRIYCESKAPRKFDNIFDEAHADVFSKEFKICVEYNGPKFGPMEYLRISRALLRYGVGFGLIWVTGGSNLEGDESVKYEEENKRWLNSLFEWVQKGD